MRNGINHLIPKSSGAKVYEIFIYERYSNAIYQVVLKPENSISTQKLVIKK